MPKKFVGKTTELLRRPEYIMLSANFANRKWGLVAKQQGDIAIHGSRLWFRIR